MNGTVADFEELVMKYLGGPISNAVCHSRRESLEIAHLYSMTGVLWGLKMLRECHGDDAPSLTAFLPGIRNLDGMFPMFINYNCPNMPPLEPFAKENGAHHTSTEPYNYYASAKSSLERGRSIARALCAPHVLDYACFQENGTEVQSAFGEISVPDVCKSVYANDAFRA